MLPMMPNYPQASITTEQIQKYLDENKKLILAILDNQNLGKLAECAQYQAQLQKNLMYLAAIADAQPQTATMPGQIAPHPGMQPGGGFYMQHPEAAAAMAAQQATGLFPQKMPLQFNSPQQMPDQQHQQYLHQQHQQAVAMMMQGQMGMRPNTGIGNNGMQQHAAEAGGTSKQDGREAAGSDGHGGGGGGDGGSSLKKGSEDK